MPDWRAIVEAHLAPLPLSAARREEICRELGAHLEDEFEALRQRLPEEEAKRRALDLLAESDDLMREIRSAETEDPMNQRTRAVWLPSLVMLGAYTLLFVGFVRGGAFTLDPGVLYYARLVLMLILGAVGAWWARALGATPVQRAVVSISPMLMPISGLLIALPVTALKTGRPLLAPFEGEILSLVVGGLLIPAAALLLGAAPFLKGSPRVSQPSS